MYQTFSLLPQSNNMKCSHIQFELTSSDGYVTIHDGESNTIETEWLTSCFLALNAMQVSIDSIGSNTSATVVMAFISGTESQQTPVRRECLISTKTVFTAERFVRFSLLTTNPMFWYPTMKAACSMLSNCSWDVSIVAVPRLRITPWTSVKVLAQRSRWIQPITQPVQPC